MVTGLRVIADAAPRGEWELHLTCEANDKTGRTDDDDQLPPGARRLNLDNVLEGCTRARDMVMIVMRKESSGVVVEQKYSLLWIRQQTKRAELWKKNHGLVRRRDSILFSL